MRRLLATTAVAAALAAAAPASAEPGVCTPERLAVGACAEYVCVDICGPEIVVDVWCDLDNPKIALALCAAIDNA